MREYKESGSLEARNKLVMYYSYIARTLAVELSSSYYKYASVEEMVNQGVIALIDSIERFDPDHGVKFTTYAFTKVRGAIFDYVRKQDWLPKRVRHNTIRINNAYQELTGELCREPTREEMAKKLEMSPEEYDKCNFEISGENTVSFEALTANGPLTQNLLWPVYNNDSEPENRLDEQELRQELAKAIDSLNEQERLVLSLYYHENLVFKEIGQVMGITQQRVGQINRKLVQKLRDRLEKYMKG